MKKNFWKIIGGAALAVVLIAGLTEVLVTAQSGFEKPSDEQQTQPDSFGRGYARDLEGSWNVQVTDVNCQTGAPVRTFPALNTFMRGGTMQEFSTGAAPLTRAPGHGVWNHESGHNFTYAFQFFRFAADGTFAGSVRARRQVQLNFYGSSYYATATAEILNPSGTVVATACSTETASRFE